MVSGGGGASSHVGGTHGSPEGVNTYPGGHVLPDGGSVEPLPQLHKVP